MNQNGEDGGVWMTDDEIERMKLGLAAGEGEVKELLEFIAQGCDVDGKNDLGETALHSAAFWGHCECIKALLEAGADPNARSDDSKTPLHLAEQNEELEAMRVLVEGGADVNAFDGMGFTALHSAVMLDRIECVRLLIELGADVDARDGEELDRTALGLVVACHGSYEVAKALIDAGADAKLAPFEVWSKRMKAFMRVCPEGLRLHDLIEAAREGRPHVEDLPRKFSARERRRWRFRR